MANRMVVIPEDVYNNLLNKDVLQDGLDKRLTDASIGMTSALHSVGGTSEEKFLKYDQKLKEVQRLLAQRRELAGGPQTQLTRLLEGIAKGVENMGQPRETPASNSDASNAREREVHEQVTESSTLQRPVPPPRKSLQPKTGDERPVPLPRNALPATQKLALPPPPPPIEEDMEDYLGESEEQPGVMIEDDDGMFYDYYDLPVEPPIKGYPINERDDTLNEPPPAVDEMDSSDTLQVAEYRPNVIRLDLSKVEAQQKFEAIRNRIMKKPELYGVTEKGRIIRPREEGDRSRVPKVYQRSTMDQALEYLLGLREGDPPPGTNDLMMNLQHDPLIRGHIGRIATHRPTVKDLMNKYQTEGKLPRGRHKTPFKVKSTRAGVYRVANPVDETDDYLDPDPVTVRSTREVLESLKTGKPLPAKERAKQVRQKLTQGLKRSRGRSGFLLPSLWNQTKP